MENKETGTTFKVSLDSDLHKNSRILAAMLDITLQELYSRAIKRYVVSALKEITLDDIKS